MKPLDRRDTLRDSEFCRDDLPDDFLQSNLSQLHLEVYRLQDLSAEGTIARVVLGSRLMGVSPMKQGMPWWKYLGNRFLTVVEQRLRSSLIRYHTGYRAFSRQVLEAVHFQMNSDGFIFDQEIVAQIVAAKFRIAEVSVPTRYFPEASSASFVASSKYGLGILWLVVRYALHKYRMLPQTKFEPLGHRYTKIDRVSPPVL